MGLTPAERETILRYDEASSDLTLYTASPKVMRQWKKKGIKLTEAGRDRMGKVTGWGAVVPLAALRPFKKLTVEGRVK